MRDNKQVGVRGRGVGKGPRELFTIDASATDWMRTGKCAQPGADPEVWFGGFDDNGSKSDTVTDDTHKLNAKRARRLCAGCPVTATCAEYAIAHDLRHGVWGGMTPYQRTRVAERRMRAAQEEEAR